MRELTELIGENLCRPENTVGTSLLAMGASASTSRLTDLRHRQQAGSHSLICVGFKSPQHCSEHANTEVA